MDNQLEQIRDIWVNAFFTGNYEVLAKLEDSDFKVVYEQEDRVETNYTRYEKIAHAVNNGVWKPKKLEILTEDFEFDRELTQCKVTLTLENEATIIQELWIFRDDWKVAELRFCQVSTVP